MAVRDIPILLLQVADVARSLKFWRDALGVPFGAPSEDGSVEARLGGTTLLLHPDFRPGALKGVTRGAGIGLHLGVPDADACHAELKRRGFEPLEEPDDKPWGREFTVVDPDGYRIEILGPARGR